MDHRFVVDRKDMSAPYSKTMKNDAMAHSSTVASSPVSKRRKSACDHDDAKTVNTSDDTATALGGIMEHTLRTHLEKNESTNDNYAENETEDIGNSCSQNAHIGDVHGKPRLFPLKHMKYPQSECSESNCNDIKAGDHFLTIAPDENWPRCPRCKEAARPAVLMFNDLDWVYNMKQEKRWQKWCESLLKICKKKSRRIGATVDDCLSSDGDSTVYAEDISDNGWEDVSETSKCADSPLSEQQMDETKAASAPSTSEQQSRAAPSSLASQFSDQLSSSPPLKVAILEIGCGFNVPTCRVVAERLTDELIVRGGGATLIRINPTHPEPDDDTIVNHVLGIEEKGLEALKMIDGYYKKFTNLNVCI